MCRDPLGRTGLSGKACPLALAASLSPLHPSISLLLSDDPSLTFPSLSIFLIDYAPSPGFISLPETRRLLQLPLVVAADGQCVCDNLPLPRLIPFLILTFPPSPLFLLEAWLDGVFFLLAGASPELNWEV